MLSISLFSPLCFTSPLNSRANSNDTVVDSKGAQIRVQRSTSSSPNETSAYDRIFATLIF
jgi:hypothetical protein